MLAVASRIALTRHKDDTSYSDSGGIGPMTFSPPPNPLDTMLAELGELGEVKVWSLLVSIFGDLAAEPSASLPGPGLTAVAGGLGVRPEAVRVALHRLRKDGWVDSEKVGRIGRYTLTDTARAQTFAVRSRVYAPRLPRPPRIFLVVHPVGQELDGVPLTRSVTLCDAPPTEAECLSTPLQSDAVLPAWAQARLAPADLAEAFVSLRGCLMRHEIPKDGDPLALLCLRLSILHQWRRLVLRHHPIAEALLGEDWIGARCRATVADWLHGLPRVDLADVV